MRRIADHRVIQIPDLDFDVTVGIGDRTQISDMAVAADPDRRSLGMGVRLEPFIKFVSIAADKSVRRARHLQAAPFTQQTRTVLGTRELAIIVFVSTSRKMEVSAMAKIEANS